MPTYTNQQGVTVTWNSAREFTEARRIEAAHLSAASSGTVTLSNNNANVSTPSVSGDDISGIVTLNFSSSISADTQLTKVNFGTAYTTAPRVLVKQAAVGTSNGVGVDFYTDVADVTTAGFFIRNRGAIAGSGGGKAVYIVVGVAGG